MNRTVTTTAAAALVATLVARPHVARAQTVEIGVEAPPPRAPAPAGDATIDITAAPPPQTGRVAPPYGYPSNAPPSYPEYPGYQGAGYGAYSGYTYPPQAPPDTPQDLARMWSRHLAIGGTVGVGSPLGWLGVWVDANVSRLIGFEFGLGTGGNFGAAFALGVNFRPVTWGHWAPYFNTGFSVNISDGRYDANPALHVPGTSWWWNIEGGFEYRARTGLLMRFAVGFTTLLNTGDFTNLDFMGTYGQPFDGSAGFSPFSAADAHDHGDPLGFFQIHYDLGGFFNF